MYDADDEQADRIYESVHEAMDQQRKRQRRDREGSSGTAKDSTTVWGFEKEVEQRDG